MSSIRKMKTIKLGIAGERKEFKFTDFLECVRMFHFEMCRVHFLNRFLKL